MRFLKNALLALGATAIALALIELLIFPRLLETMPSNVIPMTQDFGAVLAQSSKAGLIPRDYIMLTGDSYAEGHGDAWRGSRPGSREPYASAHFIAEHLGRDVISVGRGGWGSTNAALAPANFLWESRRSLVYRVEPPAAIFYYVFEGNDFEDNLHWARFGMGTDLSQRSYTLAEIVALVARYREATGRLPNRLTMLAQSNLPAVLFMMKALDLQVWQVMRYWAGLRPPLIPAPLPDDDKLLAAIGGKLLAVPNRLHRPPRISDAAVQNSVLVLQASAQTLLAENPGATVMVVYIPSPLMSYDMVTDDKARRDDLARAAERSVHLRRSVCEVARELGIAFVDVTPTIRRATRKQLLHGPIDWSHLSLDGYSLLGSTVAEAYAARGRADTAVTCEPAPL
jgi:hypothetical protein